MSEGAGSRSSSSERSPEAPRRLHRGFRVFSASYAVLLLILVIVWWFGSGSIVRAGLEDRGLGFVNHWLAPRREWAFEAALQDARGDFWSAMALAVAAWGLVALVYLVLGVWRRARWLPLVPVVWWLGVELIVAPWLNFPLWLVHYNFIRNVDHRPQARGGDYNSDTLRGTPEPSAFRPEGLNLIFLGDSFTVGLGVASNAAFPQQVGEILRAKHPGRDIQIANFGWTSSSPILSHRYLVDLGAKYSPDIVLMCVDMTDFSDDLRYERMLERRGLYWFYDKLPLTMCLFQHWARTTYRETVAKSVGDIPPRLFFATDKPLEETRRWLEPLAANVEKIHRWCVDHGAEFMLVVLPRNYQYSARELPNAPPTKDWTVLGPWVLEPFRFFDELRPRVGYPIVSLLADFRGTTVFPTCQERDPHWNPDGHRVAAEAIAREIEPIVERRLAR